MQSRKQSADLEAEIERIEPEKAFSADDVLRSTGATRSSVDDTIARLLSSGRIRDVRPDLYYRPRRHAKLGEIIPDPEKIVFSAADHYGHRVMPSGAVAANRLGLTTQVPARSEYISDGPSYELHIGPFIVKINAAVGPQREYVGTPIGLVIEAFNEIGKDHITPEMTTNVAKQLSVSDRKKVVAAGYLAPEWLRPYLAKFH